MFLFVNRRKGLQQLSESATRIDHATTGIHWNSSFHSSRLSSKMRMSTLQEFHRDSSRKTNWSFNLDTRRQLCSYGLRAWLLPSSILDGYFKSKMYKTSIQITHLYFVDRIQRIIVQVVLNYLGC